MSECKRCNRTFVRFSERRSLLPVSEKISPGHQHYGLAYHRWGVCSRSHYTKLNKTNTEWLPCMKCLDQKIHKSRQRHKSARHWKKNQNKSRRNKSVPRGGKKSGIDLFYEKVKHNDVVDGIYYPPSPNINSY